MKFTPRDWAWLATCLVVAVSAVTNSIRVNRLAEQVDSLNVFTLSVQTFDQNTRRPTDSITVCPHPSLYPGQIMKLWSSSCTGPNSINFEYIGAPPFAGTISVTNAGYQEKVVPFDSTNNRLPVYLMHKT